MVARVLMALVTKYADVLKLVAKRDARCRLSYKLVTLHWRFESFRPYKKNNYENSKKSIF